MSFKNKQQGFTIVELLIVIIVIGILAGLVITTFTGINCRARDTDRQNDIKTIHSHLETYYATHNSSYPDEATVANAATFPGLDPDTLLAPNSTTPIDANAATTSKYRYDALPADCTTAAENCTSYILEADLEGSDDNYTKNSLNN